MNTNIGVRPTGFHDSPGNFYFFDFKVGILRWGLLKPSLEIRFLKNVKE
jgi:hypothetical protein